MKGTCDNCVKRGRNLRFEPGTETRLCLECWPTLWDEFLVTRAVGYPAPFRPHPNTIENARRFASEHRREPEYPATVMKRSVSAWEEVA